MTLDGLIFESEWSDIQKNVNLYLKLFWKRVLRRNVSPIF